MKIEKVIKQLESIADHTRSMAASPDADEIWKEDSDALEFAITALRSMQEAGEPLSLEQLKQMDGKPVFIPEINCWALITKDVFVMLFTFPDGEKCSANDWYQSVGPVYAYPPAHIDRRAWTAEWVPTTDDDGCVWLKCSACEYDLDSMEESNPFCPSCGRAMTEEAWAELERRVRDER